MTDGMFCAQCLSQYQEILSKTRLFGTRNCSKLGRSLYSPVHDQYNIHTLYSSVLLPQEVALNSVKIRGRLTI